MPFLILLLFVFLCPPPLRAQVSPHPPADALLNLQVRQPPADVSSPVTATAAFDPPVARAGETVFYRVAIDGAGGSIQWPRTLPAPPELKFGPASHGQLTQDLMNRFRPLTSYLYKVRATATGQFTVSNFVIEVGGKPVKIPAATLDVNNSASPPPARRLMLEVSATNVFLGQPLRARVLLPASPSNRIEALQEIEFDGDGFMSDRTTMRQAVETIGLDGRPTPAFVYEINLTPILAGTQKLSAQAFAAGRDFHGPIRISAHVIIPGGKTHYVFLVSNPVSVNVRPLPTAGRPADFSGSIGTFAVGPPRLSTNRIQVGQPVRLTAAIRSYGGLNRLVPPTLPRARGWEIIADNPSGLSYTLIPLTDKVRHTPAIPFSCFDPATASYKDLTVPPLPVTVTAEGLPTELPAMDAGVAAGPHLKLSSLSPAPGNPVASLTPPQLRGWLVGLQVVPVLGILGLWRWDRHRRYLEAHPDIVRRGKARRALRREKRRLRDAARRGDAAACVRCATNAMKIACAPHLGAHPQAVVCAEVLAQLGDAGRSGAPGETVRKLFAAADAQFAAAPQTPTDWPALQSGVDAVLRKLEEQL